MKNEIVNQTALYYHFSELKLRLQYCIFCFIITFLTCYNYCFELIYIFTKPFLYYKKNFIFTDITEFFYTNIEICFFVSFYLMILVIMYHAWCFFIPSAFAKNRYKINLIISIIVFIIYITVVIIYIFLLHILFAFLLHFQINNMLLNIELQPRIKSYVNLSCRIFIISTLLWVVFFALCFFIKNTMYTIKAICNNRIRNLFILLLISSVFTPPDLILQICLTITLICILEILLLCSFLYSRYNDVK